MYFVYEDGGDLTIVNLPSDAVWTLRVSTFDDYSIYLETGDKSSDCCSYNLGASFLITDCYLPSEAFTDFANDLVHHILQKLIAAPAPQVINFTNEMYRLIQDSYLDEWIKKGFIPNPDKIEYLRNWKA